MMTDPLAALSTELFVPLTDDEFLIGSGNAAISTRLADVKPLGHAMRTGGGFSLLFVQGDVQADILQQGMHRLTHETLGTIELFLVPIGPVNDGFGYEAVFT